jgi:8-oxo-dGTP pyrophosphatase MutT (NUDIX family)
MSPPFRRVGEQTVYTGSLVSVGLVALEGPAGVTFEREIVHHPGAVVVVPITDSGAALMVRQFRAAAGTDILEVPAGKRDVAGEPTEQTAARELAEEVGRRAGRLDLLAQFYNSPGFCDEHTWLYLARDLEEVDIDRQGHEEEAMTVEEVALDRLEELVASGGLVDAKSIIGLALARSALARSAAGPDPLG